MLNQEELSLTIETLAQRANWFRKALKEGKVRAEDQSAYKKKLALLQSAVKKLDPSVAAAISKAGEAQAPPQADETPAGTLSFDQMNVLVVDDDECSRDLLNCILEDLGIEGITAVDDGEAALLQLRKSDQDFNIVLCDWNMPGMNGLDLLKTVRAEKSLEKMPFVMVTGMGDVNNIQDAIKYGVSDYIVKPIDMDILQSKLKKLAK